MMLDEAPCNSQWALRSTRALLAESSQSVRAHNGIEQTSVHRLRRRRRSVRSCCPWPSFDRHV